MKIGLGQRVIGESGNLELLYSNGTHSAFKIEITSPNYVKLVLQLVRLDKATAVAGNPRAVIVPDSQLATACRIIGVELQEVI